MGLFSLESKLQECTRAEGCDNCLLWQRYQAMKAYLSEDYYPWVQAKCRWFTDHGEKHIESVISSANQLLAGTSKQPLTCVDMFVLLSSIIWHDVGMVKSRASHAKETEAFLSKVRETCLPDPTFFRFASHIAQAHSSEEGLNILYPSEDCTPPCSHKTCSIYPKSLAAVLRFADEISENRTRVNTSIFDLVPEENRIYWAYASSISATRAEPERNRVVVSVELQREDAIRRYECPKKLEGRADSEGKISLIEYLVCRLEKMNRERAYCFPHITRYAMISSIEVRLQICEGTDCEKIDDIVLGEGNLGSTEYPELNIFDEFFREYPQLLPDALQERGS